MSYSVSLCHAAHDTIITSQHGSIFTQLIKCKWGNVFQFLLRVMAFIMLRLSCCRNSHRPFKELDASEEENDTGLSILSFHIILLTGGGREGEFSERADDQSAAITWEEREQSWSACRDLIRHCRTAGLSAGPRSANAKYWAATFYDRDKLDTKWPFWRKNKRFFQLKHWMSSYKMTKGPLKFQVYGFPSL